MDWSSLIPGPILGVARLPPAGRDIRWRAGPRRWRLSPHRRLCARRKPRLYIPILLPQHRVRLTASSSFSARTPAYIHAPHTVYIMWFTTFYFSTHARARGCQNWQPPLPSPLCVMCMYIYIWGVFSKLAYAVVKLRERSGFLGIIVYAVCLCVCERERVGFGRVNARTPTEAPRARARALSPRTL